MDKAGREKRNQEILESYNLGNSYFKMAETFGLSKGGVHKIIQAIKNEKPIIPQPKQETIEEVASVHREVADSYQPLFNFFSQEHNLILTITEMDEIVLEVQKFTTQHKKH